MKHVYPKKSSKIVYEKKKHQQPTNWAKSCREKSKNGRYRTKETKREESKVFFLTVCRKNGTGRSKSKITSMTHVDSYIWTYFYISTFYPPRFSFFFLTCCIYLHKKRIWIAFHEFFSSSTHIDEKYKQPTYSLPWVCQGFYFYFFFGSFCCTHNCN